MGDVGPLVWCVSWCGRVELWVGVCGSSVSGSGCVNRGSGQKPSGFWPLPLGVLWRCPTLPQPIGCSTIGAAGLSFQVRNVCWAFPRCCDHHKTMCSTLFPPALLVCVWGVWVDRGSYSGCGNKLFTVVLPVPLIGWGCCLVLAH